MAGFLGIGGPNLGVAIGLQAAPDPRWQQEALEGMRMAQAKQVAQKKKSEDIRKLSGIKPPSVDPFFQKDVDNATESLDKGLFELARSGDPDADYKARDLLHSTQSVYNKSIEGSKYHSEIRRAMEQDKATGSLSPEAREAFDALRSGDKEKLSKIEDPTGRFAYNAETGVPVYRPIPNIKTDAVETALIKNPDYRTAVSAYQNKEYHNPKGGIEIFNIDRIPETRKEAEDVQQKFGISTPLPTLEDQRDLLLHNPDFTERKSVELINTGGLPRDFLKKSPEQQQSLLGKAIYKDLQAKNGAKITRKVENPNAPKTTPESKPRVNGNTWSNDKVRVQFNNINGVKTWDFSNIKSDAENKNLVFNLPDGTVVTGTPNKFIQRDPSKPPVLQVSTPEIKSSGIVTTPSQIKEVGYDIAAPKIEDEYGFNPETVEAGINPQYGKQRTTTGDSRKESAPAKVINGTQAQLDAAAKAKKLSPAAYRKQLEDAGYKINVK